MNAYKRNILKPFFTGLLALFILQSCSDFLDIDPRNALTPDEYYRNVNDADAAIRGIYGKLVNLAPQYVILNELRADLMDIGPDATYYMRQLNYHDTTNILNNPFVDPKPFFSLINDCNDVLKNFDIMLKDLKMSKDEYNQRYSDVGALRSWLYLQLVIQYGNVPYITKPFEKVSDIEHIGDETIFPKLSIENMVDSLLNFMQKLPYLDSYTSSSLLSSIDGFTLTKMYINKRFLLGDLYLWKGMYREAATQYKAIMATGHQERYKVPEATDLTNVNNYNSGYVRYYTYDSSSTLNNWPRMFSDINPDAANYQVEWIWTLFYDDQYPPFNPFLDYFYYNNYFIPSQPIIEKWNAQIRRNDFKKDFRGINGSYQATPNGNTSIMKFLSVNSTGSYLSGKWGIYRAGLLHLRFAEAANRDNQYKLAYAFINDGIRYTYDSTGASDLIKFQRFQQTFLPPPYDFDARYTGTSGVQTYYARGEYRYNAGIRRRVFLKPVVLSDTTDSLNLVEKMILDEAAMEMAFEGNRWGDLVRLAIRRNEPEFLADKIYEKLNKSGYSGADAVRQRLMERKNWFLPLR